jgi:long-chain acyl-CoA synthetase
MTSNSELLLGRLYRWERELKDRIFLTQPLGGGSIRTYTFGQAMDEARRMATYLRSLGFAPGSSIAILSKNCAHMFMADIAIWMAGYVSVALYPTLTADTISYILSHSDSKALFIGKLDGWESLEEGVPKGLPCVSFPLSPKTSYPAWECASHQAPTADRRAASRRRGTGDHHLYLWEYRQAKGSDPLFPCDVR